MKKRIKILFIHSYLMCGGAEQALFDLVCLMDPAKFDITVVAQYDGGIWEQKFKDAGIHVVSFWDCQRKSSSIFTKLQNYSKRKKLQNALQHDGQGIVDLAFKEKFDIVVSYHVNSMHAMGFSSGAKSVKYIHGDIRTNPGYRETVMGAYNWLPKYDKIICVSETAKKSFETLMENQASVCMHFNPLNSQNIRELSKEKIDMDDEIPYICAVGRLAEEKGFDRLIRIHKRILDSGLTHRLVIVGDGPEREKLCGIIQEENAADSVELVGYTPNPYPYMKKSMFVVCSSFTEGLPVIAMEALSLGVPIVSSVPSIGELFGDQVCGIVTENDDASLEAGIIKMLKNDDFLKQTQNGAKNRSTYFDGSRMVQEIEDELIQLLD